LEIIPVWGWQCCVGKGDFTRGDRGVYVPPDYVVPEFGRITVRKLRGQISQGLLIPVPEALSHLPTGVDVMDALGITRYEPVLPAPTDGEYIQGPTAPVFDVENYQRYPRLEAGEMVVITEKIHGTNARYCWSDVQFCGGRRQWLASGGNVYWEAFRQCPAIGAWCQAHPGLTPGGWTHDLSDVPLVPHVYTGPFDLASARIMAEADSRWPGADHMAEGVVIVPVTERMDPALGRVCLKIVSNRYLTPSPSAASGRPRPWPG
jgi:hypothetical protein